MSHSFSSANLPGPTTRQYAVVIYLPNHLERIVAPLRERFDPDYNLISAHVTVVFPFETDRPLDDLTRVIRSATADSEPIDVTLSSIDDFYPGSPIIFWKVQACDGLNKICRELYAKLDLPLPHKRFLPHVTVAREISNHRVVLVKDEIATYLPDEKFTASALDLVSPIAQDHWVSVRTFPLGPDTPLNSL
ncbi:hypothetical protein GF377_07530 [candidate division GN15 bacterium]|nr:hypothetical protein [candidate division GN15 bacterium]